MLGAFLAGLVAAVQPCLDCAASVADAAADPKRRRLHAARAYLDAWQQEPFVRELDEQFTAVAATL